MNTKKEAREIKRCEAEVLRIDREIDKLLEMKEELIRSIKIETDKPVDLNKLKEEILKANKGTNIIYYSGNLSHDCEIGLNRAEAIQIRDIITNLFDNKMINLKQKLKYRKGFKDYQAKWTIFDYIAERI